MPKPIDPEVEAGEARLRTAMRAKRAAERALKQRTEDLAQVIADEFRTGKWKAAAIAKVVDYTPEHVRRILRAHGIEGDPNRLTPVQRAQLAAAPDD